MKRGFSSIAKANGFIIALLISLGAGARTNDSQLPPGLQLLFQNDTRLTQAKIDSIRAGTPVTKVLPSRTPGEVVLFGSVYVHAAPRLYIDFARDFERLRKFPNYLALAVLSDPPQLSDFEGFSLDDDDIAALKNCQPRNCLIQLPAQSIEYFRESIDWSAPDASEHVNRLLQKGALERLVDYQREGNGVLGAYDDKSHRTDVAA